MSADHRHDRRCYWDHVRCGWVCPRAEEEAGVAEPAPEEPAVHAPEPVPAVT